MIPELFSLHERETWKSAFGGDRERSVTLLKVRVQAEPYQLHGRWYDVFRRAEVDIELDGVKYTLICEPYALPEVVDGLRIEADLVQFAAGGLHQVPFTGDARFAALDAAMPWVPGGMRFPLDDYRWRASNYLHSFNGFVHVVERDDPPEVYYHRGEDYGSYPNRIPYFAMFDGTVVQYPTAEGDGDSNVMTIRGAEWSCVYGHADAVHVLPHAVGDSVAMGDKLALTGATWAGHVIDDPHLHVHLARSNDGTIVNSYPYLSELYRRQYPDEVLAVAGGFRFARAGASLTLSGARSLVPGGEPPEYLWTFTDGTQAHGAEVIRQYPHPGTFTEQLTVRDAYGRCGHDFVMVMISDDSVPALPMAFFNHYPVRGLRTGQAAEFLCHCPGMPDADISFGDGECHPYSARCEHAYRAPGFYVVELRGHGEQGCEGVFKIGVLVEGD